MANLTADVRFSGDNHVKSHILLDSINWHAYQGRGLSRGCEKKQARSSRNPVTAEMRGRQFHKRLSRI